MIAHEVVTIRVARGGEFAPLVIPLPKDIAEVIKYEKGDQVWIYTDGERVYIEKLEDPELWQENKHQRIKSYNKFNTDCRLREIDGSRKY